MTEAEQITAIRSRIEATATAQSADALGMLLSSLNATAPANADPNALGDVIGTYTERFDRLQFLFLEQEAKEQFFRLVLEQNDTLIDSAAIARVASEATAYKLTLDQKAQALKETTQRIQALAEKFHEDYKLVSGKYDALAASETRLIDNKAKLELLVQAMNEHESKDPSANGLSKLNQLAGSLVQHDLSILRNVESSLVEIEEHRVTLRAKMDHLQVEINRITQSANTNAQRSAKLEQENKRLTALIEDMKNVDKQLDGEQQEILAQEDKLSLLTKIWCKLYQISDYKADAGHISFRFQKFPSVVSMATEQGKIQSLTCEGLGSELLSKVMTAANASSYPLHSATTTLYTKLNE